MGRGASRASRVDVMCASGWRDVGTRRITGLVPTPEESPVNTTSATPRPTSRIVDRGTGRRWLLTVGLLLLAGPLLFDLGYALHPSLPEDVASALAEVDPVRDLAAASKVMVAFGGLLMIGLVLTLRQRLVPQRGRTLATVAAGLASLGLASNSLSQATHGYLLFWASDPEVDRAAGTAILEAAHGSTDLVTLPVSFLSVPLFALGVVLFAIALWRAGTVPRWVPVAIILAGIGAGAVGTGPAMLPVLLVDLAAFWVALVYASERHDPVPDARRGTAVAT